MARGINNTTTPRSAFYRNGNMGWNEKTKKNEFYKTYDDYVQAVADNWDMDDSERAWWYNQRLSKNTSTTQEGKAYNNYKYEQDNRTLGKDKKLIEAVEQHGIDDQTISAEEVNKFLTKTAPSFFEKYQSKLKDNDYDSATDNASLYNKKYNKMKKQADIVRAYLNRNKDGMTEEEYKEAIDYIRNVRKGNQQLKNAFNSEQKFYSQFDNADEANKVRMGWGANNSPENMTDDKVDRRRSYYQENNAKIMDLNAKIEQSEKAYNELLKKTGDSEQVGMYGVSLRYNMYGINNKYDAEKNALKAEIDQMKAEREKVKAENEMYKRTQKILDDAQGIRSMNDFEKMSKVRPDTPTKDDFDAYDRELQLMEQERQKRGAEAQNPSLMIPDKLGVYLEAGKSKVNFALNNKANGNYGTYDLALTDGYDKHWDFLTKDDIDMYYYLLNKRGQEEAYKWLDDMQAELDRRANENTKKVFNEGSALDKAVMNALSVPANVVGGATAFASDAVSYIRDGGYNPYGAGHALQNYAQTVRGETAKLINNATNNVALPKVGFGLGDAYEAVMSGVDSLLGAGMFGGGYTVLMGLGSASSTAKDLYLKGATKEQMAYGGLLAGAAEYAFEKISIENLLNTKSTKNMKDLILQTLKQGGIEASEEMCTEVANIISNAIVMGSQSDWKSWEQNGGWKNAIKEATKQVVNAGLGGFVSGGAMGAGGSALNLSSYNSQMTQFGKQNMGFAQVVFDNAKNGGLDIDTAKAEKAYADLTSGTALSRMQKNSRYASIGKMLEGTEGMLRETATKKSIKASMENFRRENGDNTPVSDYEVDKVYRELHSNAEWSLADRKIKEVAKNYEENVNHDVIDDEVSKSMREMADQTIERKTKEAIKSEAYANIQEKVASEGHTITGVKSVGDKGVMVLNTESGDTVKTGQADYSTEKQAVTYEMIASMETSTNSANQIASMVSNVSDDKIETTMLGVKQAYQYGRIGVNFESIKPTGFINDISPEMTKQAYNLGRADAIDRYSGSPRAAKVDRVGGVSYIGNVNRKKLTRNQKQQIQVLDQISKDITHNKIVMYQSYVNSEGVRVVDVDLPDVKAGTRAPNGVFSGKDGTIYIDVNAGNKGSGLIMHTAAHELTHFAAQYTDKFESLKQFVVNSFVDSGKDFDALVMRKIQQSREIVKKSGKGRELNVYEATEEVIADAMSGMFTNTDALYKIAELKQHDKTLYEKLKEVFFKLYDKVRAMYKKLSPESMEGQMMLEMKDSLEMVSQLFSEALVDAGEKYQGINKTEFHESEETESESDEDDAKPDNGPTEEEFIRLFKEWGDWFDEHKAIQELGLEYDEDTESIAPSEMFSERTWTNSEYVQFKEETAKKIAKELDVDIETATRYIDDINSVARSIADDRVRLDYDPNLDPNATVIKPNSEYTWTVDMSTLCAKRLLFTGTFDAIQRALPNTVFDSDDIVNLRKMMQDRNYQVACGICYVESTRREIGAITNEFIERYKKSQKDGKPITRINSKGKEVVLKEKGTQDTFIADKNFTPTLGDLNTTDIDKVKVKHNDVYRAYLSFMNARGQAKPKLLETRAEYKGEILNHFKTKTAVNARNKVGGLRLQSFSDFEIPHMIDMMQIVMDMSRVGLKSQAYTKVPAFAEVFGDTGIKINLSLIAKGDGIDENGNLIFDDVEGIDHNEAFRLRDEHSKNVGTILVGKNDDHIIAAMADPRIDFIIPFHKSSWKESLYDALGLTGYADYTATQNEKPIDTDRKIKNFDPSEYWDEHKTGDENAQIYLKKCEEDGRIPKFPQFKDYPGYWKLLIDFKMYDNEGVYSPQEVVRPIFDRQVNEKILEGYEGGHRSFPVAQDVVDDFVSDYKKSHDVTDTEGNTWDDFEIENLIDDTFIEDWLVSTDLTDIMNELKAEIESPKPIKKRRIDEVNKKLKELGVQFNGGDVASWTDESVEKYLKDFASSQSNYAQAYITYMSPMDYLKLTSGANPATIERIINETSEYGELDTREISSNSPMRLYVKNLRKKVQVDGHEGRHRMLLFAKAGFKKVPVLMFDSSNKYDKEHHENMILKPQNFGQDGLISRSREVTVTDVVPFSTGNKEEIIQKFGSGNADANVMYSNRDTYAPTFYSHMSNVIDGIKTDKVSASGLVNYLKGKGVKDEEIKWSGIEAFLEGKKSVSKSELKEFATGSMLQIEEKTLSENAADGYNDFFDKISEYYEFDYGSFDSYFNYDFDFVYEFFKEDVDGLLEEEEIGKEEHSKLLDIAKEYASHNESDSTQYEEYTSYEEYTIKGTTNYREILFKLPGNEYQNSAMKAHWDENRGVIAHARVDDVYTSEDEKMLFVEEIQSDWHNEGHKKGYGGEVPDAPFKNGRYVEYVMKSIIRSASENGYDFVGWTTGKIQEDRWSAEFAEGYRIEYDQDIPKFVNKYGKKWGVKAEKIELESGYIVWGMRVSDSMKQSVLYEGQPMFSERDAEMQKQQEKVRKALERQNTKLKKDNEYLKELVKLQGKVTDGKMISKNSIKKVAGQIMRQAGATGNAEEFRGIIDDLYTYIRSGESAELEAKAESAVDWLVDHHKTVQNRTDDANAVLGHLIGKRFRITEEQKNEIESQYGSYNDFRKKLFGSVNITTKDDAPLLESSWAEFAELFPYAFDEDTNVLDMPLTLLSVVDQMKNNYESDMEEYAFSADMTRQELLTDVYDGYWSVSTLHTVADRYQKQINELKAKHKAQVDDIREEYTEKVRELKADYKEQKKNASEYYRQRSEKKIADIRQKQKDRTDRRKTTEVRNKVKKIAEDLRSGVWRTKGVTYPEGLVTSIIDICEMIDPTGENQDTRSAQEHWTAMEALRKLREEYDNMENYGYDFSSEHDEYLSYYINQLAPAIGNKPLRDMDRNQITQVYEILNDIKHLITTATKLYGHDERMTTLSAGESLMGNMDHVKSKGLTTGKFGKVLREWTLNPMRAVREMTGYNDDAILYKLMSDINEGRIKQDMFVMESNKMFEALRKTDADRKTYNDAVEKPVDFGITDTKGRPVMISKMQAMQALLTYERATTNDAQKHLESPVLFIDTKLASQGKMDEAYNNGKVVRVNPEFVKKVNDKLTPWDRKYMEAAKELFNVKAKNAINETTLITKHRIVATDKNYIPYVVNKNELSRDSENLSFNASIENEGMLKRLMLNADTQIIISGLNTVLDDHIKRVGKVYGLTIPIRNWNKVFNMKEQREKNQERRTVKKSISNAWGESAVRLLDKAVADMQGSAPKDTSKLVTQVKNAFVTSTLASNISVTMKQFASYPTAGAVLSTKSLGASFGSFFTSGKAQQELWDEIDAHTPQHYTRRLGMSIQELGELNQTNGLLNKVNHKMGMLSPMNWIQAFDVRTTQALWNASKLDAGKKYRKGSEEYWNYATELYNKTLEDTQPMYDSLHRAQVTKNQQLSAFVMFQTQPLQNSGILHEGYMARRAMIKQHGKNSAQAKEATRKFVDAAVSQLGSHLLFTGMTLLSAFLLHRMNPWRDKNKEVTWESVGGEFLNEFSKNYANAILPFANYLFSAFERVFMGSTYDVLSDPVADKINGTFTTIDKLKKSPSIETASDLVAEVLSYLGVPASNVLKIERGVRMHLQDINNGTFMEAGVYRNSQEMADRIYRFKMNGDEESLEKEKANFKSETAFYGSLREGLTNNDPRINEAAEAKKAGKMSEYKKIAKSIIKEGVFTQNDVVKAINAVINKDKESEPQNESTTVKGFFTSEDAENAIESGNTKFLKTYKKDYIETQVANGKSKDKAKEGAVNSIRGIAKTSFEEGDIKKSAYIKVLSTYCGMTEEEARIKVGYGIFKDKNPDIDISDDRYKQYIENESEYKSLGISEKTFGKTVEYYNKKATGTDSDGDGRADPYTRLDQYIDYLASLNASSQVKTALFKAIYPKKDYSSRYKW